MRILLDTHIALWAITDDPRLSARARALILAEENAIHVSAASLWEIAIKHALGEGRADRMPISAGQALAYFRASGYGLLAITADHAAAVEHLPRHHRDPFERMLVAQARAEPMHLVTRDRILAGYGEMIVLV